jgi:hypothetical protein
MAGATRKILSSIGFSIGILALTMGTGDAQVPYYELRGSISGTEELRTWYSASGLLDARAGNSGATLRYFNLHGDWDPEKVRFVYKCESNRVGIPQEWGTDQCPAATDESAGSIRRFSIQLAGSEAGNYELTYSCWVAQDGHKATGRGTREAGEWCGIAHSDENVRVTRVLVSLKKRTPPFVQRTAQ